MAAVGFRRYQDVGKKKRTAVVLALTGLLAVACVPIEESVEICWVDEDSFDFDKYGPSHVPEETCVVIPLHRVPPNVIIVRIDGVDQPIDRHPPRRPDPHHPRGPVAVSAAGGTASIALSGTAVSAGGGTASIATVDGGATGASGANGDASVVTGTTAASGADGNASVVSTQSDGQVVSVSAGDGQASIAVVER